MKCGNYERCGNEMTPAEARLNAGLCNECFQEGCRMIAAELAREGGES
jgi:hypothetical protein